MTAMIPDDAPLVGRDRELSVLRAAVSDAAAGRPGAVLVAAEAGGGKTRLVRALLDGTTGSLVLRAQCVDLGDPGLPYLAVVDVLRSLRAAAVADPDLAAVVDHSTLVDELTTPRGAEAPVDESRRLQVFDATAALLGAAGAVRGPVVVVVEDLHWVDASSADFLRFLLSRMLSERLAVVVTVRTDGLAARPAVRQLLSELGRLPTVQRLDLAPWTRADVEEYLARAGTALERDAVAEIVRRTGGNPYYVQALARSGIGAAPGDRELPRELADLLVGRMDGLPDVARAVVRCAAVVPHAASDRLLREVVALPDVDVDRALRLAVAEGIVRADGDGYVFAHDLLRAAVYDDLLPGERARLHGAVASALESGTVGPAHPGEVAHHFAEAQDAAKVLVWSLRAADQAMGVLAPGEALQHFERALAQWPQVTDAEAIAELPEGEVSVRAALAARLAGEPRRALQLARRAIRLCDARDDASGAVRARVELARQLVEMGATDQALGPAQDAVRLAESADAADAALAHAVLARALLADRRPAEARPQAERAFAAVRNARAPGLEVDVLTTTALLDEIDGHLESSAQRLGEAVRSARAAGELTAESRAHYALASLHYYNGDVAGSLPILRAATSRVAETGLRWSESGIELKVLLAVALYVSGDLDGSLEVTRSSESRPPDVAAARLAAVGCYAAVARGLPDADRRLAGLADSWDADPQVALVAGGCEADRLVWSGDPAGAVAIADRAQAHLDTVAGEGMYGGLWLSALALAGLADEAEACRLRRDDAGAAAAVRRGESLVQRVERIVAAGHGRPGDLGPEGRAWHARAMAERARLAGEPAVEAWREALAAFGYGHVYEEARCHWRLAEALVAAGDRSAAVAHAQAAAAAAERMSAVPLARAVAATISRSRLAGAEAGVDAVLTRREQEVLALVAEGLTNREIGARLFISEKTASVHLSNLMTKLNVSSRTEAVTVAHRRGLLDVT
jgi:DNA-binding CsgD family transcriptional regulator/tetratricopeptide (TPR) repeat protein